MRVRGQSWNTREDQHNNALNEWTRRLFSLAMAGLLASTFALSGRQSLAHPRTRALPILRWNGLAGLGGSTWVPSLDPARAQDTVSSGFDRLVYGGLVSLLPNGKTVPNLARTYRLTKNGLTWTFVLKQGLAFANGDPVTAYDFKWSLARAALLAAGSEDSAYYDNYIKGAHTIASSRKSLSMSEALKMLIGVRADNKARTVAITTTAKIPFFLETLTYPTADVLNPIWLPNPTSTSSTFLTNTCDAIDKSATGPFVYRCTGSGSDSAHHNFFLRGQPPSMTLVPNSRYRGTGGKPRLELYAPVIDTVDAAYSDFLSGSLDVATIPSAQVAVDRKHPPAGSRFMRTAGSGVSYLTPNQAKSYPFHLETCRLALAYGINRNEMARAVHKSIVPMYDILPPTVSGYDSGTNNPHYNKGSAHRYAKMCLKGLHLKTFAFTLPYSTGSIDSDREFKIVLDNLNALPGFKVTLQPLNAQYYFNLVGRNLSSTKTAITETRWFAPFPDPYDYCTLLLRSGQHYDIGNFSNTEYNTLVDKAAQSFNWGNRKRWYSEAQHIALSDGALISLFNSLGFSLTKGNVTGLTVSPTYPSFEPLRLNWANVRIK